VQSRFILWGVIDFAELQGSDKQPFDVLSFGAEQPSDPIVGLAFSGVAVDMTFVAATATTPAVTSFGFDASHATVDTALTTARQDSLFAHFPLSLKGLVQGPPNTTPADQHAMSVSSPLTQSAVTTPWYALSFKLDLGSLGALAGEAGFEADLVAAWSPNPTGYTLFLGLVLPGATGGAQREISLEGILKLTFGGITLTRGPTGSSYVLLLSNIALKLLSLTFPPGQTNLVLLGNPDDAASTTLGWFASYAKNPSGGAGALARPARALSRGGAR
jgi:hypothetical protein